MSPFLKRVIAGMGANAYGQVVTIITQLASLPLFLNRWSVATYGVWLMLSAIPSYISMADAGMVTAAGNRMTMLMETQNNTDANRVFQSAQLFVISSCLVVAIFALPLIAFLPIESLSSLDTRLALLLLVAGVLVTLASSLAGAAFRATHRYAVGTSLDVTARLLEWLGGLAGLFLSGSFFAVALGMIIMRIASALVTAYISTNGSSNLTWGFRESSGEEVRSLIKPSLGFMAFPIGNALTFQGFTLATAYLLGPAAVAVFNIYRTIARIAVQAISILSHALWPEFSRLYGAQDTKKLRFIFYRSAFLGTLASILLSITIYIIGPALLKYWTHSKIDFLPLLMALILIYSLLSGSLHTPRTLLMATSNHSKLGVIYLIISTISLLAALPLGSFMELPGMALAMVFGEFLMISVCLFMALQVVHSKANVPC